MTSFICMISFFLSILVRIFLSCVFWLFYPGVVRHKKYGPTLQKISTNEGKKERTACCLSHNKYSHYNF